jgi:hypothetical protein
MLLRAFSCLQESTTTFSITGLSFLLVVVAETD